MVVRSFRTAFGHKILVAVVALAVALTVSGLTAPEADARAVYKQYRSGYHACGHPSQMVALRITFIGEIYVSWGRNGSSEGVTRQNAFVTSESVYTGWTRTSWSIRSIKSRQNHGIKSVSEYCVRR